MSKSMKKSIFGIVLGFIIMFAIAYLPPVTDMMSRQAWQFLGCFAFMLTCLISGALPDWVAIIATMFLMLAFKITDVAGITSSSPALPTGCASAFSSCPSVSITADS